MAKEGEENKEEKEEEKEEKEEECLARAGQADGRPAGSLPCWDSGHTLLRPG